MIDDSLENRLRRTFAEVAARTTISAESASPVDLEDTGEPRHVRVPRWATGLFAAAVALVLVVPAVVWATHDGGGSHVSVADGPTSTSVRPTNEGGAAITRCPGISASESIQRVTQYSGEVPQNATIQTKLLTWYELRTAEEAAGPVNPVLQLSDTTPVWAVEVLGTLLFPFQPPNPPPTVQGAPWGVFAVNAENGAIYGPATGTGAAPRYWDALPDYSASCKP
jgi:hypothetical protein